MADGVADDRVQLAGDLYGFGPERQTGNPWVGGEVGDLMRRGGLDPSQHGYDFHPLEPANRLWMMPKTPTPANEAANQTGVTSVAAPGSLPISMTDPSGANIWINGLPPDTYAMTLKGQPPIGEGETPERVWPYAYAGSEKDTAANKQTPDYQPLWRHLSNKSWADYWNFPRPEESIDERYMPPEGMTKLPSGQYVPTPQPGGKKPDYWPSPYPQPLPGAQMPVKKPSDPSQAPPPGQPWANQGPQAQQPGQGAPGPAAEIPYGIVQGAVPNLLSQYGGTSGMRPLGPGEFIRLPNGGTANEMTWTVPMGNRWTVVPGLWLMNGTPYHLTADQAQAAAAYSGLWWPNSFASEAEANAFAQQREANWEKNPDTTSQPALWKPAGQ